MSAQAACLSLVNCLIAAQGTLELKLRLRYQFLEAGILPLIQVLICYHKSLS